MRQFVALFMSITLLFVSSVPMLADAASCELPAHAIVMQKIVVQEMAKHAKGMHGTGLHKNVSEMSMHHASNATEHVRHAALNGDLPLNRIECSCGCHRSVDALPHLLAPHAFSVHPMLVDGFSVPVAPQVFVVPETMEAAIPVPPPRKLILS